MPPVDSAVGTVYHWRPAKKLDASDPAQGLTGWFEADIL
jgi:hypothetical protein